MKKISASKLLILDDLFPHPHSVDSWRGTEFHAYLDTFFNANIYTTLSSIGLIGELTKEDILARYAVQHPEYINRLIYNEEEREMHIKSADMAYCIFLNNIWYNLDILEEFNIPFVFELYPGGGFFLYNEKSNKKLEKVMKSSCFKGVIVTSTVTADYLLKHNFCKKEEILLMEGCVLNNSSWKENNVAKKYYGVDKNTFDIVFAAYRYSEHGIDKGYDTYIEVAKKLHQLSDRFQFHVIGNFDDSILNVRELETSIHFYGIHEMNWFNEFYQDMDVLISPNKAFVLDKGAFDGFPTGCGVDAVIRKLVLIASDELNQNNNQYTNGRNIFIVNNDAQIIADRILFLYQYPYRLKSMGECGHERAINLYSYERQIQTRIDFINSILLSIS